MALFFAFKQFASQNLRRAIVPSSLNCTKRFLNVHEHHSLGLLNRYGIATPKGKVSYSPQEAEEVAKSLGVAGGLVIKAQVLAGGRGKGHFDNGFQGGVHLLKSPTEVSEAAKKMLGHKLITKQTGADGRICNAVLVCEQLKSKKEYYFAILMDRSYQGPVMVASSEGGMDIEGVAASNPEAIIREPIDINKGLGMEQAKKVAKKIGIPDESLEEAANTFMNLYKLFIERDATLVEINPLSQLDSGKIVCMDAKINFDDNADFRQEEIQKMRDITQEDVREVKAAQFHLNYIGLDGSIGCLVNGAGLAMATMDIIKLHGGSPANFLDVGGGANATQVTEAFKIISADPNVSAILVNIFGGIMRCDVIAQGIINAVNQLSLTTPLVVRLQGTNVAEGKKLIEKSGLRIFSVDDLDEAAEKACQLAQIVKMAKQINVHVSFELPL